MKQQPQNQALGASETTRFFCTQISPAAGAAGELKQHKKEPSDFVLSALPSKRCRIFFPQRVMLGGIENRDSSQNRQHKPIIKLFQGLTPGV